MNLKFSCCTILIIIISVDCGLVKQFLGDVKEEVHTIIDNTVNKIGEKTHKITEGLGVFLHRNEGNKFPGHQSVTTTNQISNENKIDNMNNDKREENTNSGVNKNNSQHYSPVYYTPATLEHTTVKGNVHDIQNSAHDKPTTSNINKNEIQQETSNDKVKPPEATTNMNIQHTTESTATNIATTIETDPWFNGVDLENILPNIIANHPQGNKNTGNANTGSYTDTNELGTGDNQTNNDTNAAKDENKKPIESQASRNKPNLVSDQMYFKDNKPKPTESSQCAKPLVKAANGDCLEPIEIDVRKHNEPKTFNIFQAEGCPSGYARAQDNTCQKSVG